MTPAQYRAELKRLGLSVRGARHFLGVSERTSRRWANGVHRIPKSAAMTLTASTPTTVKRAMSVQSERAD